jgi:hypothetical protein
MILELEWLLYILAFSNIQLITQKITFLNFNSRPRTDTGQESRSVRSDLRLACHPEAAGWQALPGKKSPFSRQFQLITV